MIPGKQNSSCLRLFLFAQVCIRGAFCITGTIFPITKKRTAASAAILSLTHQASKLKIIWAVSVRPVPLSMLRFCMYRCASSSDRLLRSIRSAFASFIASCSSFSALLRNLLQLFLRLVMVYSIISTVSNSSFTLSGVARQTRFSTSGFPQFAGRRNQQHFKLYRQIFVQFCVHHIHKTIPAHDNPAAKFTGAL